MLSIYANMFYEYKEGTNIINKFNSKLTRVNACMINWVDKLSLQILINEKLTSEIDVEKFNLLLYYIY